MKHKWYFHTNFYFVCLFVLTVWGRNKNILKCNNYGIDEPRRVLEFSQVLVAHWHCLFVERNSGLIQEFLIIHWGFPVSLVLPILLDRKEKANFQASIGQQDIVPPFGFEAMLHALFWTTPEIVHSFFNCTSFISFLK